MAWGGIWHVDVDGTDLNDGVNYVSMVPEVDNVVPQELVLTPRDGDYPVFVRSQPTAGPYTILIALKGAVASAEDWYTSITALKTLFAVDQYHTLTVQARGMPSKKSVQVIVESIQADYRSKTVVVSTVAPDPTLT